MSESKIFGIGFHKTGTTSLRKALEILGYRVTGPFGKHDPQISQNALPQALNKIPHFDAFQDNPWPLLFKELDQEVPHSKFILTLRPTDEWLRSIVKHFDEKFTYMRQWIYGVGYPRGHETIYRERYEKHNQSVRDYFQERPQDLLVFNITQGESWKTLCPFLNKSIPRESFPHVNRAESRSKRRARRRLQHRIIGFFKRSE